VGGQTLLQWKFPEALVEAVRWHHRPERCSLAMSSLLYLAEEVSESHEDLPSVIRRRAACQQAGIEREVLAEFNSAPAGYLETLRFAA
jgi:HD-like signal output (HDOD) protein